MTKKPWNAGKSVGQKNEDGLAPCPLCKSDKVFINSGVAFAVKCQNCWHVKIQCFNSPEEAKAAWNKLFDNK